MKNLIISAFCITTSLVSFSGFALQHPDARAVDLGTGYHPAAPAFEVGMLSHPQMSSASWTPGAAYSDYTGNAWTPGAAYTAQTGNTWTPGAAYTAQTGNTWTPGAVYTAQTGNAWTSTGDYSYGGYMDTTNPEFEIEFEADPVPESMPSWTQ